MPGLIDDLWAWETVDAQLALAQQTRVEVLAAAASRQCICGGDWLAFVVSSLVRNNIDVTQLCRDIYYSLQHGRASSTPVLVLCGAFGGEGKSLF